MNYIAPMTILVSLFLVIGSVARQIVVNRRMREIARLNAELQAKLLDKLTAAGELQAYIASDAGKRFVEAATIVRSDPHGRILASVQSGILLFAVGVALQASRHYVGDEARNTLHLFGTLGMLTGVGFLASAAAVFGLSKHWGLIPGRPLPTESPDD
ncbi:MAG: hypothetical protein ABIV06_04540 [Thermoanaerobaculia bacterium]